MKCPICDSELELTEVIKEIPYFGKVLFVVIKCKKCKYRKGDIEFLERKNEKKIEIKIKDIKDLNILVIRSSYAKISIPEFELELIPGISAESFITTVEGILLRFKKAVETMLKWKYEEKDERSIKKCIEILNKIENALNGKEEFTLIIEDPTGNSGILKTSPS